MASLARVEATKGMVQVKLVREKVDPINRGPANPPLLEAFDILVVRLAGNPISKRPNRFRARTTKRTPRNRFM